jgi:hypothetical protein
VLPAATEHPVMMIAIRAGGLMPRSLSSAVVVGVCAVAIASCGSSGKPHTTGAGLGEHAVAYASCMRSHGVTNFPDATSGNGFEIPPNVDTQSAAYQAATHACTKLQPGPSAATAPLSEGQQRRLLSIAKCMRKRGVHITDPTFQGRFITLDEPDQTTIQSPTFKRAEAACRYPVPRSVGPVTQP